MQRPHQVVVLVLDGALPLDVGIPAEVFHPETGFPYEVSVCGVAVGTVPSHGAFGYAVPQGLDALADADTIVVPGYAPAGRPIPVEVREALLIAASRGARIASICYGAFALADAGLLDGLRATTHWDAAQKLAARYPQITVEPNVLFVDEGSILTSAGAAAGLDLCLHIVRCDLGVSAANEIARGLVTAPYRTGGQAQYLPKDRSEAHGESLAATREWAMTRLEQQLTIAGLAAQRGCRPARSCAASPKRPAAPRCSGSSGRGSTPPANSWRARGCRSTASRTRSAWEPDRTSDCISDGSWMCPPRSTAPPSPGGADTYEMRGGIATVSPVTSIATLPRSPYDRLFSRSS